MKKKEDFTQQELQNMERMKDIMNFLMKEADKMEIDNEKVNPVSIITRVFQILGEEFEEVPTIEEFKTIYVDLLRRAFNFYEINFDVESQSITKMILMKDFSIPTDKLNRQIFDIGFLYNEKQNVALRKDEEISFVASTIMEELSANNSILKKLDIHDKRVMVTIANLFNSQSMTSELAVTSAQIYRAMNNSNAKPRKEAVEKIENSIKKLAGIRIEIDKSKLENIKIKEKIKAIPLSGNLIDYQKWAILDKKSNKYYSVYRFMAEPILFTFARCLGDIWSIPNRYINIQGIGQDLNIVLADYVASLNRGKLPKLEILFETIYEKMGVNEENFTNRTSLLDKKRKIREQMKSYFEECKGDMIESFEMEKNKVILYKKSNRVALK